MRMRLEYDLTLREGSRNGPLGRQDLMREEVVVNVPGTRLHIGSITMVYMRRGRRYIQIEGSGSKACVPLIDIETIKFSDIPQEFDSSYDNRTGRLFLISRRAA